MSLSAESRDLGIENQSTPDIFFLAILRKRFSRSGMSPSVLYLYYNTTFVV
jgi:hypothetical protein